jgi:DNA/RNA-binding domain of Phe-tRNA-synthetase-like protein
MSAVPQAGWVAPEVRVDFPELRLWELRVDVPARRTPPGLKERLKTLSSRFHGARAIAMRNEPIPHAYRVLARHVGIDPDTSRSGLEAVVLERLQRGGFRSSGLLADAMLVAVVETAVPLWAMDEDTLEGALGVRAAGGAERLGRSEFSPDLRPGRLVVADERSPVAELLGDPGPGHEATKRTTLARVYTLQPSGVPDIHVEEALWSVADALE